MFTVSELTTPLTREAVELSIYDTLASLGVTTTTWKPGSVVRSVITIVSLLIASLSSLVALVAKSAFLDDSSGDWLTLLARNTYGVERIEATFASGSVTLTNGSGNEYTLAAGDLILLNPSTAKTYRNASTFTLSAGATLSITVIASEAGSASNASPGAISDFVTTLDGLTGTNPTALVGVDTETDAALRQRCRESLGALSPNGPRDAYAYFARTATRADGGTIGVTRVREVKDNAGGLTVYVATASGGVTGTYTDTATDLGAIHDSLEQNATPLCVTLTTSSATPVTVPVTYSLWMYNDSGLAVADVQAIVSARLTTWFSERPIGGDVIGTAGKVWRDQVTSIIGGTRSEIFRVSVTAPLLDVDLDPSQVPVLGTVTGTIYQVQRGAL